jgi:ATP-binding cassette subfamily B (MDR/TAP) protein 1
MSKGQDPEKAAMENTDPSTAKMAGADTVIPIEKNIHPDSSTASSVERLDSKVGVQDVDGQQKDSLGHLPENERSIISRQLDDPESNVKFLTLFRYASSFDKLCIAIGLAAAIIGGAILPLMTVLFAGLAQTFTNFGLGRITPTHMQNEINHFAT